MKNSLVKMAFKSYKNNFLLKTTSSSFFGLALIIVLFLGYVFPLSIFLTIPFIVLPFLLSFILDNATQQNVKRKSGIFAFFPAYFTKEMFGGFRVIIGFLKSLLAYVIVSSVLITILYLTKGQYDASLVTILSDVKNATNNDDLLKIIGDLQENQTFILMSNISEISAIFVASFIFLHHIFTNSFKYFFNLIQPKPMPMKVVNYFHKHTFKKIRKPFYKDYYSSIWFVILIYMLGFASGAVISTLLIGLVGSNAAFFSLIIGVLFILYFLPYIYDVLGIMGKKYMPKYFETIIELSTKEYEQLKKEASKGNSKVEMPSEEQYKKIMDSLNGITSKLNEAIKEDKADKDSDENNKKQ